jgi:hypothetical protein
MVARIRRLEKDRRRCGFLKIWFFDYIRSRKIPIFLSVVFQIRSNPSALTLLILITDCTVKPPVMMYRLKGASYLKSRACITGKNLVTQS